MADRYLRASGAWNGPVWAATSDGVAGSAATPTVSDDVFIEANYTVTLTANAQTKSVLHTNGRINLGSYELYVDTTRTFVSSGSTARTIDMGSGKISCSVTGLSGDISMFSGSNLTFIKGTGIVQLDVSDQYPGNYPIFGTLSKDFNDVIINIYGNGSAGAISITGSPTFRSLIIQSKNSAAHTVNFDDGATISVTKFIAIGTSPSSRLTVTNPVDISPTVIYFSSGFSSYGQYVNMVNVSAIDDIDDGGYYIGSNSVQSGTASWTLQDPPKISTLVDPMTDDISSNSRWSGNAYTLDSSFFQKRTNGLAGGGYRFIEPGEPA